MTRAKDYAVYRGDVFITLGTAEECAKYLDVKPSTIKFISSPAYQKRSTNDDRLIAFVIEED